MKKYYTILFLFVSLFAFSQNNGINFQGVGRNSSGAVLATQKISLRFTVIQGSETGSVEYVESKEVTTNAQGIFSVVIGDGTQISKTGNFTDINWKINPKFLKIEMDPAGGTSFAAMGTTRLQSVPFAYYANGVNADNVDGVLSASKGGTGVASISALKTALGVDQIYTTTEKNKLAAVSGTNTGDQDLSGLATISQLSGKANTVDLALKAPLESPTFTGTVTGITKAMVGLSNVDNTADLAKPISSATQAVLDLKASTTTLALKENVANKSSASDLGGLNPSDVLYPTQKAVKDYVTANTASGGVADGGITNIKLADGAVTDTKVASGINKSKIGLSNVENTALSTWTGNSNLSTVGTITSGIWSSTAIDYSKLDLNNKIVNSDLVDGTITMQKLGISKTDLTDLGLAPDEELIIYQPGIGLSTRTDVNLNGRRSGSPIITTSFYVSEINENMLLDAAVTNAKIVDGAVTNTKIGDGEITDAKLATGINKNKVGLNNVENTALSTWNGSNSITTIGAISSGIWSATTIAIANGGTGATNASDARTNLGLIIGTNVQAPLISGTDYLAPNGSAAYLTNFPMLNQNTTGNATTATLADNVSATSNTTLMSLENLTSVGIISTGVWSATTISVNNGGTGSTSLVSNSVLLGNGTNPLQVVSPGASGNVLTSNGTTWTSAPLTGVTAGNLSGTTLAANVINTSITSVGILTNTTVNGKMTVGNSSESSSSAILEVNSTSKGFLPPKMSASQRDAISNPASGLMIWCNNCGSTGEIQVFSENAQWLTITGQTPSGVYTPSVGENYQGGIVAYLLTPSDFGYDANVPHGLIASIVDLNNSNGIQFWNGRDIPIDFSLLPSDIGKGYSNTQTIVSNFGQPTNNYAAGIAYNYRGGGYSDWYLPSLDELIKLYLNRVVIGGFTTDYYWSSTSAGRNQDTEFTYAYIFDSNYSRRAYETYQRYTYKVRAVRSF